MKQGALPYAGWSLQQLRYWSAKAARSRRAERLETLNALDLVLGAQFDKGARKALNEARQEMARGL